MPNRAAPRHSRVGDGRSGRQPGNRLRADIVAAGYGAQRFAVDVAPFDRLALMMRGEGAPAAEFDALGLGVGAAPCCAFEDAAALQLRRDVKDRKDDLGKVRGRIEERLGKRADARPGLTAVRFSSGSIGAPFEES